MLYWNLYLAFGSIFIQQISIQSSEYCFNSKYKSFFFLAIKLRCAVYCLTHKYRLYNTTACIVLLSFENRLIKHGCELWCLFFGFYSVLLFFALIIEVRCLTLVFTSIFIFVFWIHFFYFTHWLYCARTEPAYWICLLPHFFHSSSEEEEKNYCK